MRFASNYLKKSTIIQNDSYKKADTPSFQILILVKVVFSFRKWPINFASNSEIFPRKTCFEFAMYQEKTSFGSNDKKCIKNNIAAIQHVLLIQSISSKVFFFVQTSSHHIHKHVSIVQSLRNFLQIYMHTRSGSAWSHWEPVPAILCCVWSTCVHFKNSLLQSSTAYERI